MIITIDDLANIRKIHRNDSIVYLAGTFDLLHYGHLACIQKAKSMGEILVVSVESDKATKASKGKNRPNIGEQQRVALINSLRHVNYALINELRDYNRYPTQLNVIRHLQPDVFAAAPHDDWAADYLRDIQKYVKSMQDCYVPYMHTTEIITHIRAMP